MEDSIFSYQSMLRRKRYAQRTIESYSEWVAEFLRFHADHKSHNFDEASAKEFLRHLQSRSLSTSTVNLARVALKHYYKHAIGHSLDLREFSSAFGKREIPKVPDQDEILRAVELIKNPLHKDIVLLLYGMGLELNEVIGIQINHIDFSNQTIRFKGRSRSKPRTGLIPLRMLERVVAHSQGKGKNAYLFANGGAKPNPGTIQRIFRKSLKEAGVTGSYNIRSLRYAYVTHLQTLGYSIGDVVESLGINSERTLQFYYYLSAERRRIDISPLDVHVPRAKQHLEEKADFYISTERIKQISDMSNKKFSYTKLLALLIEINSAYRSNSFLSIAMCSRAVLDHVPPLFGQQTFKQVVANYASTRSWKRSMEHLDNSLRNCADSYLHQTIRHSETYPTFQQVDFRSDLDVLLQEIVRINAVSV